MSKEQEYINFLESIIDTEDLTVFYNTSLDFFRKSYNMDNIQIWTTSTISGNFIVEHEYPETNTNSILKLNITLPSDAQVNLQENRKITLAQNITDEKLNKFNIKSLTLLELNISDERKYLLALISSNPKHKLNQEELTLLLKYIQRFESQAKKIIEHEKSTNEAKRLKQQNSELIKKENQRINFINNVVHELKNPLASILGFSRFLINKTSSKDSSKELVEQIVQAANRLSSQITDFLQISKLDSGSWSTNIQPCNIGELIKKSTEEFTSLDNNHKITCDIPNNPPVIQTDPKLVRQVLDNLISNAIKYSPTGSNITVSLHLDSNNEISVSIQDEGIGINDTELEKVFNRFYRSSSSNSKNTPGSGLGLSICKEIISTLKGKIYAKSKLNQGSTFIFSLPINK